MGLGSLDSFEIASKLQKKEIDAMPRFLSKEDEKEVAKALKYLRSASMAVKAWRLREAAIMAERDIARREAVRQEALANAYRKLGKAGGMATALRKAKAKAKDASDLQETLDGMIQAAEDAKEEAKKAREDAIKAREDSENAPNIAKTAKEQARLAGEFYLIAALGEALEQLGDDLAY